MKGVRKVGRACALAKILAACSLEVVYTGKIAITVDAKKHDR